MLILENMGATKIPVLKAIREVSSSLSLSEAKRLTDLVPVCLNDHIPDLDEKKCAKLLRAAGAQVRIDDKPDREITAMNAIVECFSGLQPEVRRRVARWVYERFF